VALTQFIKDLLFLNDKLIIPGFGGFVGQYIPAQVNTEKNILTPPVKYFIFDDALTEDDGVFASYISKKKSISISEADLAIKELVADFKKKLNNGNTLFIEDVGYLIQDDTRVIRFKRDETQNFHPESFGLDAISFRSGSNQLEETEEKFYPTRKKSTVTRILIIFLLLNILGAFSAFIYWKFDDIKTYYKNFTAKRTETPAAPDTVKYQVNEDTTEIGQYIDTSTNIRNALRYEETPASNPAPAPVTPPVATPTERSYYIIAGSFQTYSKAELHAKLLSKHGLKPEIIEFGQDLFRISVGEFKRKDDALKQLELIKSRKGAEKAWLLSK
jgi:hypothetical protein